MENLREAPTGANDALIKHRPYYLAAHAGVIPPRTAFHAQVSAAHELNKVEAAEGTEATLLEIAEQMGALVVMQPENREHAVSDDDLGILLQSRLQERVRDPLIELLISKKAISITLQREFGLNIPDSAYVDFLESIKPDGDAERNNSDSDGVGVLLDGGEESDATVNPFAATRTLKELREAYDNYPNKDTEEVVAAFNEIACNRIFDERVPYFDSDRYYDSLKPAQSESEDEESEIMSRLHLALDNKLLNFATQLSNPGSDYRLLVDLLQNHALKTDIEHEDYDDLKQRLDYFTGLVSAFLTKEFKPDGLHSLNPANEIRTSKQIAEDGTQGIKDYSNTQINIEALENGNMPHEPEALRVLRALYVESFKTTENNEQTTHLFVRSVLDRMNDTGLKYPDVFSLSKLAELVDDPELEQEIASIHDNQLIIYVRSLDNAERYSDIFDLLGSTRFLLDDGHPIVEAGRELYVKAFNKLREKASS